MRRYGWNGKTSGYQVGDQIKLVDGYDAVMGRIFGTLIEHKHTCWWLVKWYDEYQPDHTWEHTNSESNFELYDWTTP